MNNDYKKEIYGIIKGKEYFSKEEYDAAFAELSRHRLKWIKQNDVEKLFGEDNLLYMGSKSLDEQSFDSAWGELGLDYEMRNKYIFRSVDNQYFNSIEELELHEEKIKDKDLTQIINKERIWRSSDYEFFSSQEECLLYERTAFDGTVWKNSKAKNEYETGLYNQEDFSYKTGLHPDEENEVKRRYKEGINWGDPDPDYKDWEEELDRRDPFEGSPN